MKIILELLELSAIFIATFMVIIGGGLGFFAVLGAFIQP